MADNKWMKLITDGLSYLLSKLKQKESNNRQPEQPVITGDLSTNTSIPGSHNTTIINHITYSGPYYAKEPRPVLNDQKVPSDRDARPSETFVTDQPQRDSQDKEGQKVSDDIPSLKQKAEQGDASAQTNLAWTYANGEGVKRDYKAAVKWYTRAVEQGDASAQNNLGVMYANGEGVKRDYKAAVTLYTQAAKQGDAFAQNNLGRAYAEGQGVLQDHKTAAHWYTRAVEQGEAPAQNNLGVMYNKGEGVSQNHEKAAALYTQAAEQGHAHAQNNLGLLYSDGLGVTKDLIQAHQWLNLAADNGHTEASQFKNELEKTMSTNQIEQALQLARDFQAKHPPKDG